MPTLRSKLARPPKPPEDFGLDACPYRGDQVGETTCCGPSWRCARYATKVTAKRCAACDDPAPAFTGIIGVVIPSRNEGAEIAATVASIRAAAVATTTSYVLDDASSDGSCDALDDATVIRHAEPIGVGRSRNEGAEAALAAGADVGIFMDAHMRVPYGTLETLAARALETGGIVASASTGFDGSSFWGAGCRLEYVIEPPPGESDGLLAKWHGAPDGVRWAPCGCVMGGCYAISRATIERLMEPTGRLWEDVYGAYGYSEEALCLKAHILGVPVEVAGQLPVGHLYRDGNPCPNSGGATALNQAGALLCLFGGEIARQIVGRRMLSRITTEDMLAIKAVMVPAVWPDGIDPAAALAALPITNHPLRPLSFTEPAAVSSKPPVAPVQSTGLVSCLMATHGRYSQVCRALACWMAQDYPNRELVILNTHPVPLRADIPGVRVFNDPSIATLGECRQVMIELAQGEFVRTWDDDDLYLPWAISQGVRQIGHRAAWKPARSWFTGDGFKTAALADNVFEAAMTTRADTVRKYSYRAGQGDEHAPLLAGIAAEGGCCKTDMGADASYCYCWGEGLWHASGDLGQADIETRTARWKAAHQDTGDGRPLWPTPLDDTWAALVDAIAAGPQADMAGSVRNSLLMGYTPALGLAVTGTDWRRSQASQSIGYVLPGLVASIGARTAIEIGICNGFTTDALARALAACVRDGVLVSCDTVQQACTLSGQLAAKYPIRHHAVCRDSASVDWRAELAAYDRTEIDVALIDGDHAEAAAARDIAKVAPLIRPNGIMVCHDYAPGHPGVMRAVDA
ncbi:MAG TPA: glycosyltransferase, partial [Phycisphaerae bacterium]|nr:glycosyltransferase [Phycisphaerae bacterium]